MADLSEEARNSVALQQDMFRLAKSEHGLSLAVLARTRKIPLSTITGWANGTAMPAWALGALQLPDDLLSLILTPFEKFVGTNETGDEGDIDALGLEALGLAGEIAEARSEHSPGGPRIVPMERARIQGRARRLTPLARKVAA
jgi:hypothetical protein